LSICNDDYVGTIMRVALIADVETEKAPAMLQAP
jgi:hypothetical protein